ncbi:hypothetical protein ACFFX0_01760 [Citricoccus parietis]|uniref:Uncharacterized protein n=1 Tax=Citricoccus parietis TaxID=592307 RepID=A0ABV5FUP1_9MICC
MPGPPGRHTRGGWAETCRSEDGSSRSRRGCRCRSGTTGKRSGRRSAPADSPQRDPHRSLVAARRRNRPRVRPVGRGAKAPWPNLLVPRT